MLTIVDERNLGYALGAAEYLVKPLDRDRLVDVIRRHRRERPILVVDDDARAARPPPAHPRARGVRGGGGGQRARGARPAAGAATPGVILLDLMMPVMDGFEFLVERDARRRGAVSRDRADGPGPLRGGSRAALRIGGAGPPEGGPRPGGAPRRGAGAGGGEHGAADRSVSAARPEAAKVGASRQVSPPRHHPGVTEVARRKPPRGHRAAEGDEGRARRGERAAPPSARPSGPARGEAGDHGSRPRWTAPGAARPRESSRPPPPRSSA